MTVAVTSDAASSKTLKPQNVKLDTESWSPDAANMTELACVLFLK